MMIPHTAMALYKRLTNLDYSVNYEKKKEVIFPNNFKLLELLDVNILFVPRLPLLYEIIHWNLSYVIS